MRPRILYVDAIAEPSAQDNILGLCKAYRKVADLLTFDYRKRTHSVRAPWSRPELWAHPEWEPAINSALAKMRNELVETAVWFRPDVVHLGKCEYLNGETVREVKKRTGAFAFHYYGDLSEGVKPWVAEIGQVADWTFLAHRDPKLVAEHEEAGCRRVNFWWPGVDISIFNPRPILRRDYDVVFFGRPIREGGVRRSRLLHQMAATGLKVHVFGGNWTRLENSPVVRHPYAGADEFAWNCSRAKIALSMNASNVEMYASWRRILGCMACGTLMMVKHFPGLETVFRIGEQVLSFKEDWKAVRMAHLCIQQNGFREKLAQAGLQEVSQNHTWDRRVSEIIRLYQEWRNGNGYSRNNEGQDEVPDPDVESRLRENENALQPACP